MIEPMIFGSSQPISCAEINHGTVKERAEINTIGNTPFSAFSPFPTIHTIKNGDKNVRMHCITATSPASGRASSPVTEASVTVGTPTEPKAVGVEFTTRQAITARIGSRPIPASMEAGIATAVPKPAIPSMKFPNPHPMIRRRILSSMETPASIFLIRSMAPVFSVRL